MRKSAHIGSDKSQMRGKSKRCTTDPEHAVGIANLSSDEVNVRFKNIVTDLNLSTDQVQTLRGKPDNVKRLMLFGSTSKPNSHEIFHNCKNYLRRPFDYTEKDHRHNLDSLQVTLLNCPVSCVRQFDGDSNEGLNLLLRFLVYTLTSHYPTCTLGCLRCLRAFGNCTYGLNTLLNHDCAATFIAQCLTNNDSLVIGHSVELLSSMALCGWRGYQKVIEGITQSAAISGHPSDRFLPLVEALRYSDLALPCLQLINLLVNGSVPRSSPYGLEYRIHLLMELNMLEFIKKVAHLSELENRFIQKHIEIFETCSKNDWCEFFENLDSTMCDLLDLPQVSRVLHRTVAGTPSEKPLLSILQHLLFACKDTYSPAYLVLIEELVSQIVIQRDGVDPDPRARVINLDIESNVVVLEAALKEFRASDQVDRMKERLKKALQDKMEAEAKLQRFETRMLSGSSFSPGAPDASHNIPYSKQTRSTISRMVPPSAQVGRIPTAQPNTFSITQSNTVVPSRLGALLSSQAPMAVGLQLSHSGSVQSPSEMPNKRKPSLSAILSVPPPPPPPSQSSGVNAETILPSGMKPKKKYQVKAAMKRANWNKISPYNITDDSVWMKLSDNFGEMDTLLSELESQFSFISKSKQPGLLTSAAPGVPGRNLKRNKITKFLDEKNARNISILLGFLKIPPKELRHHIMTINEEILTATFVEQLTRALPEASVIFEIGEFKSEYESLSDPEKFICAISDIKKLSHRLQSILVKLQFDEKLADMKSDLVNVYETLNEIHGSEHFQKVLEVVLSLGNFMNAGSRNEQSYGFELSFLTKLESTKDVSRERTLLHFVVDVLEKHFPNAANGLLEDLAHVESTSRFSDTITESTLTELTQSVRAIEMELKNYVSQGIDDNYFKVMSPFCKVAQEQITQTWTMFRRTRHKFSDVSRYFAFDPKKYSLDEFLSDVRHFCKVFDRCTTENKKERALVEWKKKVADEQVRRQESREAKLKAKSNPTIIPDSSENRSHLIDHLMESLKFGEAITKNNDLDGILGHK